MLERVIRAKTAIDWVPSVKAGRTTWRKLVSPEGGNQPSRTENSRISSRPSQNTGMEIPISPRIIVKLSKKEYCFVAEMMPIGIPIRMAIVMAARDSRMVDGKALMISFMTGRPLLYDVPIFPCRNRSRT